MNKWICLDCSWTGSYEELESDMLSDYCPHCDSRNVDVDDREPDPLDDENARYVSDGMAAARGQL